MKTLTTAFLLLMVSPSFAQILAIRAGTVVDPAHGSSAKDQVILVEHGKILRIGPKVEIPPGAEIIDLSQEWVTPGLIDAHTHMTLTEFEGNAPFESFYLNQSSTLRGLRGMHNAQLVLNQGFTTLRDVGNSAEYAMSDVRRAIDAGWFIGPTIIDSGKIIAPFGGQSRDIPPRQGAFWQFEYIDADGPDEGRQGGPQTHRKSLIEDSGGPQVARGSGATSRVHPKISGTRRSWMASSASRNRAATTSTFFGTYSPCGPWRSSTTTGRRSASTSIGLTMAAVPQANNSEHRPLPICTNSSSIAMRRSTTVKPRWRVSVSNESRVIPGRIAPSSAGVCNSP